ncbi:hypothetical protein [Martelella soudanensis]|uniref:hypothetical protein n=1 Tax=unclassified Martelella TaxID=2629616 RepID=UPI0015DE4B91|nr:MULTISPECIES: hypothetical protein [unclassified Martelella]
MIVANEGKNLVDQEIDETEMQELDPEKLQHVTGGSFMGDLKTVADAVGSDLDQAFDVLTGSGQSRVTQIGPVIASPGMNVVDPELDGGPGPEIGK